MRKIYAVSLTTAILIAWAFWRFQQPSFECKVNQDVTKYQLSIAKELSRISENTFGSGIYGDFNTNFDKYKKTNSDLFKISEAYRLTASEQIMQNQNCFTEAELREAKEVLDFQKYVSGLK